jgi:AcrR family transcriptional regulator
MAFQEIGQAGAGGGEYRQAALVERPRKKRQTGSRSRILATMRNLLRQEPLGVLSLELVAREANVTRRTIYNHFADRDELYRVSREELLRGIEARLALDIAVDASPASAITLFCMQVAQAFADPCYVEFLVSLMRDGERDWLLSQYENRIQRPVRKALAAYLHMQRECGACGIEDHDAAAAGLIETIEAVAVPVSVLREQQARERSLDVAQVEAVAALFVERHFGAVRRPVSRLAA